MDVWIYPSQMDSIFCTFIMDILATTRIYTTSPHVNLLLITINNINNIFSIFINEYQFKGKFMGQCQCPRPRP